MMMLVRFLNTFSRAIAEAKDNGADHVMLEVDIGEGDAIYFNDNSIMAVAAKRDLPYNANVSISVKDGKYTVSFDHKL